MTLPGESDEREVKKLLKRLIDGQEESLKFAVVARGPRDGDLALSRKQKLKRKEVRAAAEADAREQFGGKAPKLDIIAGQCRLLEPGATTLRLLVEGKAAARAVACLEHLLTRGPYKAVGFTDVLLEEVEETDDDEPSNDAPRSTNSPRSDAPAPPSSDSPIPSPPPPPPPPSARSESPPPAQPDSAAASQLKQRLAAIVTAVKAAAGTPDGEAARIKASQAALIARKQEFDAAHRLLDQVDEHLRQAGEQAAERAALQAFNQRLKPLIPAVREVDAAPQGKAALALVRQAGELAQARQFDQAQKLLDQVDTLVGQAVAARQAASGVSPEQQAQLDVRAEQFQQEWSAARRALRLALDDVQSQLAKLAQALLQSNDPNMRWIAEEGLTQLLGGLRASAANIDKLANKRPAKVAAFAKPQLQELARKLDTPQVQMCDQNQFGVPVRIRRTIERALDEMVKTLESAV